MCLLLPPSRDGKQRKGGAVAGGTCPAALGHSGGREEGEKGQRGAGVLPPPDFREEGPQGGEPWRRAEAVSGRHGGGIVGTGGGRS